MAAAPATASAEGTLKIGLITDVQYADKDDGTDFSGHERRYFRNALRIAESAVECWNASGVQVVVNMGDLIDGINHQLGASEAALKTVLGVLEKSTAELRFDLIGNHELYNMPRQDLARAGLNCADPLGRCYSSVHLGGSWRAVFLDPYEHALMGVPEEDPNHLKAVEMMKKENPRVVDKECKDWFNGLPEDKHRFVPFNGAVSDEQLQWLEKTLVAAAAEQQNVFVFTHIPLLAAATKPKTVVWNGDEVLEVLHRHRDTVIAVFAGHDHNGGYAVDSAGLHHVTMNAPLTATPGGDCFAILECGEDGRAHWTAYGRACVESGTSGMGRAYTSLVLAKGSENRPEGPPVSKDAS